MLLPSGRSVIPGKRSTGAGPDERGLFLFGQQQGLGAAKFYRALVNGFTQGFAGLEVGHAFLRNMYGFAAAWVAAHACEAVVDGKAAKAADFNALSAHQGIAHRIQNGFDCEFGVALRQLTETCSQFFDEIRTGHRKQIQFFKKKRRAP